MKNSDKVDQLLRQQAALADFGTFAFSETNLLAILTRAANVCAKGLDVHFAKICQYRAEHNDLLIVAGYGWHDGVVGSVVSSADKRSTQGRAFTTGEPIILEEIDKSQTYKLPPFYRQHNIVSTIDVLIKGSRGPWGVLEVDSSTKRIFDQHDIIFLTGFANIVAEAATTLERTAARLDAAERMKLMIVEKDGLLAERDARERRLRELQAEFLHVSRLNAMGQMTAAIAHELNQPLAAITNYIGAAAMALASMPIDASALSLAREMMDKAQNQTLRAGKVIKNLRDIVEKRESCRLAEDLATVVKDAMAIVLFNAGDTGIMVDLKIADNLPHVLIDRVQVQQILFNLIRNSIEAMRQAKRRKLLISMGLGEPGFVDVTVQDTGSGLPHSVIERLFQPFVTTKSDGMGLGLTICQTLVLANGGRIWRLNEMQTGTGFRFCLPFASEPQNVLPLVA